MLYGLHGVLTKMQTKSIPYTFNRGGYYYFSRRVPSDLIGHYSYPRVVQGLRTRSPSQAKTRALIAAAKLDEYWCRLRMTDPDLLGSHLLKDPRTANHTNSDGPTTTTGAIPQGLAARLKCNRVAQTVVKSCLAQYGWKK